MSQVVVVEGCRDKIDGIAIYSVELLLKLSNNESVKLICSNLFWTTFKTFIAQTSEHSVNRVGITEVASGDSMIFTSPGLLSLMPYQASERVVICHDLRVFEEPGVKSYLKRLIYRFSFRKNTVACISKTTKRGLNRIKVKVEKMIPNGFEIAMSYRQKIRTQKKYDVVMFLRAESHKRSEDALNLVKQCDSALRLCIIDTDDLVKTVSLPQQVEIVRSSNLLDIYQALSSARVCLLPSKSEGQGRIFKEALILECLPIARNLSAYREYLDEELDADSISTVFEFERFLNDPPSLLYEIKNYRTRLEEIENFFW